MDETCIHRAMQSSVTRLPYNRVRLSNLMGGLLASLPMSRSRVGRICQISSSSVGALFKDLQKIILQSFRKPSPTLRKIVVMLIYHASDVPNALIIYVRRLIEHYKTGVVS